MRSKTPFITIRDVARVAGVSVTTASRVLNNKDDVAPETYEKVRRVIEELNYTASLAAKSMRSHTTNVIGLVLPEVTESYDLEVIKGAGAAIRGSGYDLLIYTSGSPALNIRADWERERVALLSAGLTDGCIIATPMSKTFPDAMRLVVIDPVNEGVNVPSVIATNYAGAVSAMEYLIGLGHRRIGFIGGRPESQSAIRRFEGYTDSLAAAGIAYDPDLVQEGNYMQIRGHEAARHLLDQHDRPTAIFAASDKTAMGVIDAAHERGLRIPNDLSVVGFDNIPEAAQMTPRLTTVDQSIQEIGRVATRLLIDILQGQVPDQMLHKVQTRLCIRESCQRVGPD